MEYLSTGEQFEGTAETLVDLYVGESVFERMLLFVIEKGVPPSPYTGEGYEGGGQVLILANFSLTIVFLGPGYRLSQSV